MDTFNIWFETYRIHFPIKKVADVNFFHLSLLESSSKILQSRHFKLKLKERITSILKVLPSQHFFPLAGDKFGFPRNKNLVSSWGDCLAQRKHSRITPSRPGFDS